MKSLIIREFKRNKTSFIIYCVIAVAFVWMYVALFPSIAAQSKQLDKLLKSFPDTIMKAFGVDKTGFNSVEKYLATELMSILWPIIAIVLCLSRGGSTIAGDIENKTIGLELSLPVSRIKLFFAKFIGTWLSVTLFSFVSILSIIPICMAYSIDVHVENIFTLFLLTLLFSTSLLCVTIAFSAFFSEKGKVYFSVGAVLLISYAINIFALLSKTFSFLKYGSIFHYFDTLSALSDSKISISSLIFFIAVTLISLPIGVTTFKNRDISI
ncbi:MAG: ABC transporter permease subunit [Acidimicrobiia bacterium]